MNCCFQAALVYHSRFWESVCGWCEVMAVLAQDDSGQRRCGLFQAHRFPRRRRRDCRQMFEVMRRLVQEVAVTLELESLMTSISAFES